MCWSDFSAAESADAEANLALSQNPTLATFAAVAPFTVLLLPDLAAAEGAAAAGPIIDGELQFSENYLANMARDSGLYHDFPTLVAHEVLNTEGQVISANYTLYTLELR